MIEIKQVTWLREKARETEMSEKENSIYRTFQIHGVDSSDRTNDFGRCSLVGDAINESSGTEG